MSQKIAVIIGAGPAGLTAAYELLARTDIRPIVLEQGALVGGLSRTECYKGNRIDIGGHRFFSKSDRVMRWWLEMLPLEPGAPAELNLRYRGQARSVGDGTGDHGRASLLASRAGPGPASPAVADRHGVARDSGGVSNGSAGAPFGSAGASFGS